MRAWITAAQSQLVLSTWLGVLAAAVLLGAVTAALHIAIGEDGIAAAATLYLLVVLLAASVSGYIAGICSAILADLLLNFFFTSPVRTFTVNDPSSVVALGAFLVAAVLAAGVVSMLRRQVSLTSQSRDELAVTLNLSRELALASSPGRALEVLAWSAVHALRASSCDVLEKRDSSWHPRARTDHSRVLSRDELAMAESASESGHVMSRIEQPEVAGQRRIRVLNTQATAYFAPFQTTTGIIGVLLVRGPFPAAKDRNIQALLRMYTDEARVAVDRAALAERARQADLIRQSDEIKTALLSSVSHDLRSPLTAIKAAIGSLRSAAIELPEEDRDLLLESIESQTDRLTRTVTGLLDLSRLEGGAMRPTFEAVDARAMLAEAKAATQVITRGRTVEVEAGEGLWLRADHGLLFQSLLNLIENAARYSIPGCAIHLRARRDGAHVALEVADQGPGISPEDLPHIFDKFYRGSEGQGSTGSGLGLAIVRAMVELSKGRIVVESSPSGSTFRMTFQATAAPR